MIDREQWLRLSTLVDEAWALDGAARQRWLAELAVCEPELAQRVQRMLDEESAAPTGPAVERTGFGQWLAPALRADADERPDLTGLRLGPWRLDVKLGEGGMGQVWRARRDDGLFQGDAAIKLLRGDLGASALQARFARERALLARLHHPAIARLLDAGIADASTGSVAGQAYLVLEVVEGQSLNEHVRQQVPTLTQRVRLLLRVAEAVEYAHARLVVHRDLKPSNIVVGGDGTPKLLDFGIAALLDDDGSASPSGELTRLTGRALTPSYAAPEQITGDPIGTAADVFSLGVMLYELASGRLPFGERMANRTALEHAVVHDEPHRLWQSRGGTTADDPKGPGAPSDRERVRGDLEAIAARALRKHPAERYGSVRLFIQDLQAWLDHRPVSARRRHWRHDARLWLRRHALLALAGVLLVTSLSVGLGTSLWQRQLARAAARESTEVAQYLVDLLASASPDRHGGQWPTVLQLLEASRQTLAQRFPDSPDTRLRVMQVMVETYRRLNRLDVAIPLAQTLLQQNTERYGAGDPRTLGALTELVTSWQLQGQCDLALRALEPALPMLRALKVPAERDALTLQALGQGAACYGRLGRMAEAEQLLGELRDIVAALPADDPRAASYYNILQVVRVDQGRPDEALVAISKTQPFWRNTDPAYQREILVYQRNFLVMQVRLAQYDRVEERAAELLPRIDRLLGAGSNLGLSLRHELARYQLEVGRPPLALKQREANLAYARQSGIELPSTLLPLRLQLLVARAQAHGAPPAALRAEALQLLADTEAQVRTLGSQRAEVWLGVARVGLALDDADLARRALARMEADPGLRLQPGPQQDSLLSNRKLQLDGGLARLTGDLASSRTQLQARMNFQARTSVKQLVPRWSAALDLAWTLVLQGSPQAAAALADAASFRPPGVPQGHPLDAAAAYLKVRLEAGRDDAPLVKLAALALARAQQGTAPGVDPPLPPGPLKGSMGGAFF